MRWLDPLDAAMITADVVSNPLNIGVVLMLSPPPGAKTRYVDDLHRDSLAGTHPIDPRLRRYPSRAIGAVGGWVWRDADGIDLRRHCLRRKLPPGSGDVALWELISTLHAEPLDRTRPMWRSYLIDGFADRRFALYIKLHHTVMDGVAGLRTLINALSPDPRCRSMPAFYADPRIGREYVTAHRRRRHFDPLALACSAVRHTTSGVGLAERVLTGGVAGALAGLFTDTTTTLAAAPYVPFNGRLGPERTVIAASWPKDRFRAFTPKAGVTANDVVTAVIAGALRRWLRDHDQLPRRSLVAICPISVHSRELNRSELHGNMFGAWLCPLGTNLADPAERLDLIHRSMSVGKQHVITHGAAASLILLAPNIASTVLSPMLPLRPKIRVGYNLPISHVPGPSTEMYWNGAHVEEIYPISAVYDGQGLNVTTCSYADRIGFGYVADPQTLPDIGELVPLTEQALTELELAVGLV